MFFVLLIAVTVQAQPKYERKDFSFKTTKVKNADGDISEVKLGTYAGGKLVKEYTYELSVPISEDLAEHVGTVSEEDLNFDGYPDVDIYLGYYGGFSNNTEHDGLLWNQQQHCFVQAEGYHGIGEPQPDPERKCIYTVLSNGPDKRVTSYYRWVGNELQLYLENTWRMDDEDFVDFSGMLNLPIQCYTAKLDGRIPIIIVLQRNADDTVAGYIYYPRAKNPAPIMVVGGYTLYNGVGIYGLDEYQPDGKVSGFISLQHQVVNGWDDKV